METSTMLKFQMFKNNLISFDYLKIVILNSLIFVN